MCGIVGIAGNVENPRTVVKKMCDSVFHRGPDGEGFYCDEDNKVWLGHRRLKVIDLTDNARQPMFREDVVVTYNGEIYNFQDLRRELEKEFTFMSTSDTEVLLCGYLKWGITKLLSKIKGMFAFALYDKREGLLYLVRDRMGEKPLFWFFYNNQFAFSSELKAFTYLKEAHTVDFESLDLYLTLGYVPAPKCIIKHAAKIEPGTYLCVSLKDFAFHCETYWKLNPDKGQETVDIEAGKNKTEALFHNAIKGMLYADVPLGVFLSGGVDSSLVSAIAKRYTSNMPKTFSVGYEDPSFDESRYSNYASSYLKTEHTSIPVTIKETIDALSNLQTYIDEPLADMSLIPTYLLSQKTRHFVTVALGGDGADELFLGYPTHCAHRFMHVYDMLPQWMRNGICRIVNRLPVSYDDFSFDFQLKRFVMGSGVSALSRHFMWQAHIPLQERQSLYNDGYTSQDNIEKFFLGHLDVAPFSSDAQLVEYLDLKYYLPNDILAKVDRASMANSLEVRAPFLDHTIVEYVYSLPTTLKMRWFLQKKLLKEIAQAYLPRKIVYRKKHGFGIPLGKWIKDELHDVFHGVLLSGNSNTADYFSRHYIEEKLKEHTAGRKDNRKQLWALFVFYKWIEAYEHAA